MPDVPAFRATGAMILREMATTYGRSPGGYAWAVLEPVAAIALLSVALSMALHAPSLGQSFVLFYATGYLPFLLFLTVTQKMMTALRFSQPLLAYPRVTPMDALLARFVLNTGTHVLVSALVLAGILALFDTATILRPQYIAAGLALAAGLAFGAGVLNAALLTVSPLWERIWQIATRPLFLASGILFTLEDVPRQVQVWLALNPLIHVTGVLRQGVYLNYDAAAARPLFVVATALAAALLGLLLLRVQRTSVTEA